jgi:uncharacterized glyoxalase superfamily protein PhnB
MNSRICIEPQFENFSFVSCTSESSLPGVKLTSMNFSLGHFMPGPDGKGVMHGMFTIGGTAVFISDMGGFAQPTSANLFVYVPDADASVAQAVAAGAKVLTPVADMFWGDRWGMIADPWGTVWQVATHKERLEPEEMMRRMAGWGSRRRSLRPIAQRRSSR